MSKSRKWVFAWHAVGALVMWVAATVLVEGQAAAPNADQSWTENTQSDSNNGSPSRTTESHIKSGNRTVDKKTVEVLGPDGRYQPYFVVETEQIQESPTLTRSITRTYNPGPNGGEELTQITEAETHNSGDRARTVQTTSKADYDGNLHVTEREITATTKGSDSQKTQTTIYVPSISGDLAPSMQVNEQQRNGAGGNMEVKKETLLRDAYGAWQVYEVREQTVKGDAQNRTSDDRVSRRDFDGNVSPASEVITTEKNVNGELRSTSQTYSLDVPGSTRDQTLRPLQSSTTVRTKESGRTVTEQQIVQPDPGEPDLNFSVKTTDIIVTGNSGKEETIKVTAQYPDGSPSVVLLETSTTDRLPQ